ncbi:MAG: hypothetical protein EOM59_14935 [Clostridia bacterium]|nr:hypothetical protein [Clostridia bacterium]
MELVLIIALIVALYARTYNYMYVIDDYVKRQFYPHPHPTPVEASFYDTKPTWYYRAFMVGMHCVNTSIICLLWGWQPALLYAVHPMCVWGVAWVTGNYYATTTFFCLVAYYIVHTFPNFWGALASSIIFWGALNSTYDCFALPFLFLFNGNPWGLSWFIPLTIFLNGKRFKEGLRCRNAIPGGKKDNFVTNSPKRFFLMVKVIARYVFLSLVPMKFYFFNKWGEHNRDYKDIYDDLHARDGLFWASLALCTTVFFAGLIINPEMTLWFFLCIALHSQFNLIGQFVAQRYLYIALVGMCVVVGQLFAPIPGLVMFIAGWMTLKTHQNIPNWECQEKLLLHELEMNPDRGETHSLMAQYYMHKQELNKYPRWMINRISMLIRRSVEIDPRSWESWMNYAAFLIMIGRVEEGIEATKRTKELLREVCTDKQKGCLEDLERQQSHLENVLVEAKKQMKKHGKTIVP